MSDQSKEQELVEQLNSDKRSLRIQAIVKLSRVGSSQAALNALSNLAAKSDREEAFFVSQAIAKISQKLEKKLESYNTNIKEDFLVQGYNPTNVNTEEFNPKSLTTYDFLSASNEKAAVLLQYVREHSTEIPEALLPSVGVFLGKYGDSRDSEFILKYLETHHNTLTLPYISAAEKIDSRILIPVLPYLLASKEALVRSRAVMVLQRIDQTEAERHFLHLLASTQVEDRLAALEISFLFPFNRVKNYIVALLAEEKDADVFKACATVLASNPSLDVALRILDIIESKPSDQRKSITAIFNIISVAITKAKVLPAREATPQALVATWKKERLKKFLKDQEIQLCTTTGERREEIISWLKKNMKIPEVAEFVDHLSLNPQTEDVYQRLTSNNLNDSLVLPNIDIIFDTPETAKPETQKPTQAQPQPIKSITSNNVQPVKPQPIIQKQAQPEKEEQETVLPELTDIKETEPSVKKEEPLDENKEKIKYLKQLDMQQFLIEKHQVHELAENTSVPTDVRVEALNTLLRLSPPSGKIKNLGIQALNEENIKIKTIGFKILERVAPEILKDKLSELLLSNDTNIRVRAIRYGLKYEPGKAIEALEKLISSEDDNQRSYAISCLALCPFESVYHILIKALLKEKYDLVAKQITAVLISNPDPVILTMLDKISVITTDPNLEMVVSQARNELEAILSTLPKKESNLEEIDVFQEPTAKEDKPYSVENVKKLTKKIAKESKDEKEDKNKTNNSSGVLIFGMLANLPNMLREMSGLGWGILICVLFAIIGTIYYAVNPPQKSATTNIKRDKVKRNERVVKKGNKIPTSIKMNKLCNLTGKVTQVISESSIVIMSENQEVMVKFKGKDAKGISKGDKVVVDCIPYKVNPNNIVLSNGQKITNLSK